MTAPSSVGRFVDAEAEVAILRAAAIRHLMESGATHREAVNAVDSQIGAELRDVHRQAEYVLAAWSDACQRIGHYVNTTLAPAWAEAMRGIGAAARAFAAAQGWPDPAQPGHAIPDDDRWAALLERKRAGAGSGPAAPRMDGRRAA